jgi:hypothetical protein
MPEVLGGFGNKHEIFGLILGVIEIICSVLFFLQKFNIFVLNIAEQIPDEYYLYFFASLALISGIIHLFMTLGFIGTK